MARRTSWLYKMLAYPIAAAAIYGTTFPASPEANLKRPSDEEEGVEDGKWPLLIFSHGVGCSRLMYSSLCGELASRGYIVCAVEHRDGTGPSSSIRLMDGTIKNVEFLNWQDLDWPKLSEKHQPTNDTTLRHDQLEMRQAEIEEIVKAMRGIAGGEPVIESSLRSPHFDWKRWGPEWNAVDVSKPIMMGHSLGGTVALQVAAQTERFDFSSVVAYDPAIQRESQKILTLQRSGLDTDKAWANLLKYLLNQDWNPGPEPFPVLCSASTPKSSLCRPTSLAYNR